MSLVMAAVTPTGTWAQGQSSRKGVLLASGVPTGGAVVTTVSGMLPQRKPILSMTSPDEPAEPMATEPAGQLLGKERDRRVPSAGSANEVSPTVAVKPVARLPTALSGAQRSASRLGKKSAEPRVARRVDTSTPNPTTTWFSGHAATNRLSPDE